MTEPGTRYQSEELWVAAVTGDRFIRIGPGGFPSWSADGHQIYFHDRERNQVLSVDIRNPDAEPEVILENALSWYPAVSPDGTRIAFGGEGRLAIVDRESGEIIASLPTPSERGLLPAWSPDGRQVAFGGFDDGRAGLWIYEVERGVAFQVAKAGACTLPAWSPDGRKLAFDFRGQPCGYSYQGPDRGTNGARGSSSPIEGWQHGRGRPPDPNGRW